MILEQAFHNLPEILTGYGFQSQEYEGGIVGAYSLAILQELNGRNINNPISCMQMERPFGGRGAPLVTVNNKPRYLRCDLFLDGGALHIGSKRFASYGWRHHNWIEAKFFRAFSADGKPKASTNEASNTAKLLADLLRLIALVPDGSGKRTTSDRGRYLLHVYLRRVSDHLSVNWNDTKREPRGWLSALTTVGRQKASFTLSDETVGIRDDLGRPLDPVLIEFTSTNFVLDPVGGDDDVVTFVCCLSRIETFKITNGADWWAIDQDRKITSSAAGASSAIRKFVATHINVKRQSDEEKPPTGTDIAEEPPEQ